MTEPSYRLMWPQPEGDDSDFEAWARRNKAVWVGADWAIVDGRFVVKYVQVEPFFPDMELTASQIHGLPFGQIFRRMRMTTTTALSEALGITDEQRAEFLARWEGPRIGAPPRYPPDHWLEVRDVYLKAKAEGRPRRRAIMTHFEDCKSEATARNWIWRLRWEFELIEKVN